MRGTVVVQLLLLVTAVYPQSNPQRSWREQAQIYKSEGFEPVYCFGGQAKSEGKPLRHSPFSLFTPDGEMKCCGTLLNHGRTDQHGHFLIEPLAQGRYFVKFNTRDSEAVVAFAIVRSYERCAAAHVEIGFLKSGEPAILNYIDINDSGAECRESDPHCFRK
jgi:hypothetical protein